MKRALPALLLVILTLCSLSCKKKTPIETASNCSRFEPGEVIVGFKNTVTMEEVFDYTNNLHLPITQMFGFLFASPWPTDSIPSMDTLLNTKSYIKSNGFSASIWLNVVTHVLTVSNPYWNMDAASQQDWLKTKKTLGLTPILGDSNRSGSYIMVKVPVGKERRWVEDLKASPLVSWTELNCYSNINGYP